MKNNRLDVSRRSFMKSVLASGVFPLLPGCFSCKGYVANSKVRLACCGVGGMGGNDIEQFTATGLCDIVALCDVVQLRGLLKLLYEHRADFLPVRKCSPDEKTPRTIPWVVQGERSVRVTT